MFSNKTLALIGAMALSMLVAQPALANGSFQDYPQTPAPDSSGQERENNRSATRTTETVLPGRIGGDRNDRRQERERARRAAAPTPEQNKAAAQALATAAGLTCQVSDAVLLGATAELQATYEATCASGPAYLLVASTPPQTFNCLELAGQAETNRLRDPAADVGQLCTLPIHQNPVPVVAAYAREVGIGCTVDQGAAVGRLDGNLVYEVGCADADGYQLEQASTGWIKTPCWTRSFEGSACRYTTSAESLKAWTTILAGTEAAACEVQQARKIGLDAQGLQVYEVKCSAGDGYFARVGANFTAQRVHTCAAAIHIAGGCTLTTAAPAAATTEQ